MERPVFSVTELNCYVRSCLERDPVLQQVCVVGEISNYKLYPSGHHYFSLKDAEGAVSAVLFRGSALSLRFRPENGMTVMAAGKVSVYPRDGKYQLIVSSMMPYGAGDLQLAFEQLKAKLEAEGLFSAACKKPLPQFPDTVALITSPVGAAVRDMIRILGTRWPMAKVLVVPVRVQGSEAGGEICEAICYVNQHRLADVIITGRGGGSIEDLWAFNEERVARAVFDSVIPVISAVGHEPDVTITDYTADQRASTPSNGAERCVPNAAEIMNTVNHLRRRLENAGTVQLEQKRKQLESLSGRSVLRDAGETYALRRMDLDLLQYRLLRAFTVKLTDSRRKITGCAAALDALSPLKVLSRGYAAAFDPEGRFIRSVEETAPGREIRLLFSDGTVQCRTMEIQKTTDAGNGRVL